jgi:hypothetical protein
MLPDNADIATTLLDPMSQESHFGRIGDSGVNLLSQYGPCVSHFSPCQPRDRRPALQLPFDIQQFSLWWGLPIFEV